MFYTHTLLNPFIAGCVFATVAIQVNALEACRRQSKYIADINMLLPNHSDLIKHCRRRYSVLRQLQRGRTGGQEEEEHHGSRETAVSNLRHRLTLSPRRDRSPGSRVALPIGR
jgi:hypothetical protein